MKQELIEHIEGQIKNKMASVQILNKAIDTIKETSINHMKAFFLFHKNCPNDTKLNVSETHKRIQWQDAYEFLEKKRDKKINECQGLAEVLQTIKEAEE
jgi:hypothetical protein